MIFDLCLVTDKLFNKKKFFLFSPDFLFWKEFCDVFAYRENWKRVFFDIEDIRRSFQRREQERLIFINRALKCFYQYIHQICPKYSTKLSLYFFFSLCFGFFLIFRLKKGFCERRTWIVLCCFIDFSPESLENGKENFNDSLTCNQIYSQS